MSDHLGDLYEAATAIAADHQAADSTPCADLDRTVWDELERLGFTGLTVGEDLGGSGGDLLDAATVLTALGTARTPYAEAVLVAGPALQEAGLGLPPGPLTAGRLEGTDALSGTARSVPWARHCDTVALLSDDRKLYLVSLDQPGVTVRAGTNIAGEARDDLHLDSATPLAAATLRPGHATRWQQRGALARSLAMGALAARVVESTAAYVREREQFGRPLRSFQAVGHSLARLAADGLAMQTAAAAAAVALRDDAEDADLALAVAKAETSALVRQVAAISHQLHGALGFTREHRLGAYTTRLWAWREEYGHELAWQQQLGRLAAEGDLWDLVTGLTVQHGHPPL
ncbi:acyl-CoA dehydrogenase [Streptomyces pilosus]|uniref:acyl-CoA dehydrogenase family protein n=1 Tax=Streptomyces pilosus TaxID=28893 RepID=UPI00167BD852|nr:acyl-CoA dehydrogenase family protein [Streptomyces pilosus]GGV46164.1 acyl-CoA dehydrogenase [Streptomyces pilosus]